MTIQFTVAVRTYNGANRLPILFERLQQQVNTEDISWEVLVVDNNSQDETSAIVATYAKLWRSNSQIRYVFEPRQRCLALDPDAMDKAGWTSLQLPLPLYHGVIEPMQTCFRLKFALANWIRCRENVLGWVL